jgi:hypothetical protein
MNTRTNFFGVNSTPIIPPKAGALKKRDNSGFYRVQIVRMVPTDNPIVYTAVLACGHEKRIDARGPTRRLQKTARCLICTENAAC